MAFKDILAPILSASSDEPALAAAEALAKIGAAKVTALLIELQPEPYFTAEGVVTGSLLADYIERLTKEYETDKARLEARSAKRGTKIAVTQLPVTPNLLSVGLAARARAADVSVMLARGENWQQDMRTDMFEGVLFGSGRPLLVVPPEWRGEALGRNIFVAWNGKREAARALADAAPLLEQADKISLVSVGSQETLSVAAADAAEHLGRRGLKVEVHEMRRAGDDAETLLAAAKSMQADMIVMGGYGRARLSEVVFGGVTRALVKDSPIPLFMSH